MEEFNQIQNPNIPSANSDQMPSMTQTPMKKKGSLFLVVILVLVAVGAFAWWYIGQMNDEPVVVNQPQVNQDVREDIQINKELGEIDLGNLNAEFQAIDTDLNSL